MLAKSSRRCSAKIDTMLAAIKAEKERIAHGIEIITEAIRNGGRIIFVGAGTSGRLGVLEAAEIPPTFGTDPEFVQAIIAGGKGAVFAPAKGPKTTTRKARARSPPAADQERCGDRRLGERHDAVRPRRADPGPAGRLENHLRDLRSADRAADLRRSDDAPAVGPEVIAGSTRLKAGTATKIVLNMLTTASMIRIGKTYGNLMVDVQTGSEKLSDRARRIVTIVTGLEYDEADKLLRRAQWNVKAAIVMQKRGLDYDQSLSRLERAQGFVGEGGRRWKLSNGGSKISEESEMRLPQLTRSKLDPEQRNLYDDMRAGIEKNSRDSAAIDADGDLIGPWNAWLTFAKFGRSRFGSW